MTALPEEFEIELPDNAMSGAKVPLRAGTRVTFRRTHKLAPGEPVLVRDKRGEHYVRECRLKAGGGWTAYAPTAAFPTLDSEADGLEMIAVFDGIRGRYSSLTG